MKAPASALLACSLVLGVGLGATACSSSERDTSGATTNLDDVGPDIAKLQQDVTQLREEVRALREQLATVVTTTTTPLR